MRAVALKLPPPPAPEPTPARRSRFLRVLLMVAGVMFLLGVVLDHGIDRPLRSIVERRMNESLVGYNTRVGRLDFRLLGGSMVLEDVFVHQNAHPEPAVIKIPRLRMSVHWMDLFYGHLVADALFERPIVHMNLAQLNEERKDPVPLSQHGWQEALEAAYPLKINELQITQGRLVYQDDSGFKPLYVSDVELSAGNIRNIRTKERVYPSTLNAEGRVFDTGHAVIHGFADFLAEPMPSVFGRLELERMDLEYFEPMARRFGLTIKRGFLSGTGRVEVAQGIQTVDLQSVVLTDALADYVHGAAPAPLAREARKQITQVARKSLNNPEVHYRVQRLLMKNGTLGVVNQAQNPPYRVFFSNADFELSNMSSRVEDGPARASLRGAFMGSGSAEGNATFYPEGSHANFEMKLAIRDTELKSLNDLLRARGKFDVTEGTASLFYEVRVRDGQISGYVKPLFRDIKVYDSEQDKHKNVFRKMYEGIVGGVAKMLENKKGEVATVTTLKGPLANPKANTMQIIGGLMRNAFIKGILPGFQREISRIEPLKYRKAKKDAEEKEKPRSSGG